VYDTSFVSGSQGRGLQEGAQAPRVNPARYHKHTHTTPRGRHSLYLNYQSKENDVMILVQLLSSFYV
jgi:hypothetical protein